MDGPKITQSRGVFSLTCAVEVSIRASTPISWRILTDAQGFSRWNSTVAGIEGEIREGERLRLRAPGTDRTFTPKVSDVVANERTTWTGGFAPQGCAYLCAEAAQGDSDSGDDDGVRKHRPLAGSAGPRW